MLGAFDEFEIFVWTWPTTSHVMWMSEVVDEFSLYFHHQISALCVCYSECIILLGVRHYLCVFIASWPSLTIPSQTSSIMHTKHCFLTVDITCLPYNNFIYTNTVSNAKHSNIKLFWMSYFVRQNKE